MSIALRSVLFVASILMLVYMIRKVRKSKVQIEKTVFWIGFGLFIIIISIFPKIMYWCSDLLGIQSPVNFVWITMIFILLVKQFMMTLEISQLETKVRELVEEIALEKEHDTEED